MYHYLCQQDHLPRVKRPLCVSTLNYGALLPTCHCSLVARVLCFEFAFGCFFFLLRAKNTLRTMRESLTLTPRTCLFLPSLSRGRPLQIQASYFLYNLRATPAHQSEVQTWDTIKTVWDIARLRPGGKTNWLGYFISGLVQFQMSQTFWLIESKITFVFRMFLRVYV